MFKKCLIASAGECSHWHFMKYSQYFDYKEYICGGHIYYLKYSNNIMSCNIEYHEVYSNCAYR